MITQPTEVDDLYLLLIRPMYLMMKQLLATPSDILLTANYLQPCIFVIQLCQRMLATVQCDIVRPVSVEFRADAIHSSIFQC